MSSHTYDYGLRRNVLPGALLGIAAIGIAAGIVRMPFAVTGVVLGASVLAIAMLAPLALIAVMLMVGPLDLSFMTGGFKSLFEQFGGLDMNGIRLVAASGGFLIYSMFEPASARAAFGKLGRPWVLFLLVCAATLAFSLDRLEGIRLLLKLAYPFLTFLIVVGVANTRERLEQLATCIFVSAALYMLVVNPILIAKGNYTIELDGRLRMGGLGMGPSSWSFYMLSILMLSFSRLVHRMTVRYFVFCALTLINIGLSGTRIAALAAIVGLVTVGVLGAATSANRKVLYGTLAVAGLAAVVLLPKAVMHSLGFAPSLGQLLQIMRNPVVLYNSINWQGRQLLWAVLWAAFMSSPLYGLGLGSSTAVIRESFPNGYARVAHSEYMRMATDAGFIGISLIFTAYIAWIIGVVRLARRGDGLTREYAYAAAALILAWLIVALTDNAIDNYSNFGQYIGFLVAATVITSSTNEDKTLGDGDHRFS